MSDFMIQPEMLSGAAEEFTQAGKDLEAILNRLDKTTGNLKDQWEGAAQQVFYKQYNELRQYMEGFSILLSQIAVEMDAMAERYTRADQ